MEAKPQSDENLYHTDMPVGDILRRTRIHYGQSLQDIERALRIRAAQIDAMESGDFNKLPGRVYAIGFVRSYAEYLGLDGDRMVGLFKAQFGGKAAKPVLDFPVGAEESKTPQLWVVGASAVVAILIMLFWWSVQSYDRTEVTEIPVVEQALPAPAQEELQPPAPAAAMVGPPAVTSPADEAVASAAPAAAPGPALPAATAGPQVVEGIILNIKQNSWVEIKDSEGSEVVSRVLKIGDKYFVPDRPDLTMSLGNAGGVEIEVDGQPLMPLGGVGEVRRNIPLDAKFLKEKFSRGAQ